MTRGEARKSGLPDTVFSGSNYWFYSKFGPERALAGDSGAFPANSRSRSRLSQDSGTQAAMQRRGWRRDAGRDSSFATQQHRGDKGLL
ncbi:MAG: hypothetical protein ABSE50_10900 [Xanthobacteraceae bacterium]|jgi:hypothetical protein